MQKLVSPHNKCLLIFDLHTILKTHFSKIRISIMNDIDYDNKI